MHSISQNVLDNNEPVISLYLYVEVQMQSLNCAN